MWNEERFAAACKYHDDGLSAREIAERLGGLTRNAVLGKLHRAGLARTQSSEVLRAKLQRRRQRARAAKEAAQAPKPAPVVIVADQGKLGEFLPITVLDIPRVLSLLELEAHHCRYPIGEPLEGFCGCTAIEGKPYCPGHHARAFTAPRASTPNKPSFQLRVSAVGNSTRWGS